MLEGLCWNDLKCLGRAQRAGIYLWDEQCLGERGWDGWRTSSVWLTVRAPSRGLPSVVISRSPAFLNGSSGLQERVLLSDRGMVYYDPVSKGTDHHFHRTLLADALTSHLSIGGISKNTHGYILNPSLSNWILNADIPSLPLRKCHIWVLLLQILYLGTNSVLVRN